MKNFHEKIMKKSMKKFRSLSQLGRNWVSLEMGRPRLRHTAPRLQSPVDKEGSHRLLEGERCPVKS